MKQTNEKGMFKWPERMVAVLRKSADEIEKFSLTAKLGSMELRDLFEKTKKEFKKSVASISNRLNSVNVLSTEQKEKLKTVYDELIVRLALGKAETKEMFMDQYKKLYSSVSQIKKLIAGTQLPESYKNSIDTEMRKLQIKLAILKLRYESKKISSVQLIKERKKIFSNRLAEIRKKISSGNFQAERKKINNEISTAWSSLKKAFT